MEPWDRLACYKGLQPGAGGLVLSAYTLIMLGMWCVAAESGTGDRDGAASEA